MEKENLKNKLEKTQAELLMLYEISNAMRTTLKLDEILYIILTAVTAHEGLGFNRAMLFLVNQKNNTLEGKMGIGPHSAEEALKIWKDIEEEKKTLDDLISAYKDFDQRQDATLNQQVKQIKLPLSEESGVIVQTALEEMNFEVITKYAREKLEHPSLKQLNLEYFVTVPLKAKDKVIGVILADNIFTKKPITKDDIKMLTMFANHAGLAIENSLLYEQTRQMANMDSLTKLFNHGYFHDILTEKIKQAKDKNQCLSLIMLDIDNFKKYNDNLGHQAGDKTLKEIAKILKMVAREQDLVARYGGEEFCILLENTVKTQAFALAERFRNKICEYDFPRKNIQNLTISCGIATFPSTAQDKDMLIFKADMALLSAKKEGKNRSKITS